MKTLKNIINRAGKIDLLVNELIKDSLFYAYKPGIEDLISRWYSEKFTGEQTAKSDVIKEQIKLRLEDRFKKDFINEIQKS